MTDQPEPTSDERRINGFDQTGETAITLADKAMRKASELLDQGETKQANEASSVARNASTVAGIHTEKSLLLQGKPTEITSDGRDLDQILASLNQLVPGLVIDTTAVAVTDETQLPQLPPAAQRRYHG